MAKPSSNIIFFSPRNFGVKNYNNKALLKLCPLLNTASLWHSIVAGGFGLSQSSPGHVLHVSRTSHSLCPQLVIKGAGLGHKPQLMPLLPLHRLFCLGCRNMFNYCRFLSDNRAV